MYTVKTDVLWQHLWQVLLTSQISSCFIGAMIASSIGAIVTASVSATIASFDAMVASVLGILDPYFKLNIICKLKKYNIQQYKQMFSFACCIFLFFGRMSCKWKEDEHFATIQLIYAPCIMCFSAITFKQLQYVDLHI